MLTQKLAKQIKPHLVKIEIVLLLIFCVGSFLPETEIKFYMTILPISVLSMVYFVMAFGYDDPDDRIFSFIYKMLNLSFSVGFIGILFTIYNYPYASMQLTIALIAILACLIGLIIYKVKNKQKIIDNQVIRSIIIALLLSTVLFYFF